MQTLPQNDHAVHLALNLGITRGVDLIPVHLVNSSGRAVGGQPGGEVVGALGIEQGFDQKLELLQRKGLDAGTGGWLRGPQRRVRLAAS